MKPILCPSLMCADLGRLNEEVRALDSAGADIFHCDIMDGVFVPNITLGLPDMCAVRKATEKKVDCHLMIADPAEKVSWFTQAGADIVYVHPESGGDTAEALRRIRAAGAAPGIAINPETEPESVLSLLPLCDYVITMTVHPGFAGQKFIPETREKAIRLARMKRDFGFTLMIDGACSPAVIADLFAEGADGFVLGTSALFGKGEYAQVLAELHTQK